MSAKEFLKQNGIFSLDSKKRTNEVINWMEGYASQQTEALREENRQLLINLNRAIGILSTIEKGLEDSCEYVVPAHMERLLKKALEGLSE